MSSKHGRTAAERIAKARKKIERGEEITDNVLLRLAASKWTLVIVCVAVAVVGVLWWR